jgi:hypothetical protein
MRTDDVFTITPISTEIQEMNADSTTARPAANSTEREEGNAAFWWKKLTQHERFNPKYSVRQQHT